MMLALVGGLALGLGLGFLFDVSYPAEFSFYITMALLAAMDSIVGAARSHLESRYSNVIFISGFITNAVLAGLLTFVGDKLGVPLYYAAILVFGGRLFNNLAVIRRLVIDRYLAKKNQNIADK